jgi:hypothetical protein
MAAMETFLTKPRLDSVQNVKLLTLQQLKTTRIKYRSAYSTYIGCNSFFCRVFLNVWSVAPLASTSKMRNVQVVCAKVHKNYTRAVMPLKYRTEKAQVAEQNASQAKNTAIVARPGAWAARMQPPPNGGQTRYACFSPCLFLFLMSRSVRRLRKRSSNGHLKLDILQYALKHSTYGPSKLWDGSALTPEHSRTTQCLEVCDMTVNISWF